MINITIDKINNLNSNNKNPSENILFNKLHITKDNLFYGFKGKPYIINNPLYFNISHSKDFIGIAVSDSEIGFDLEMNRELEYGKIRRLSKIILNEDDIKQIIEIDSFNILKVWTIKEAYLKYLGIGIITNPKKIIIDYNLNTIYLDGYTKASFLNYYDCDIIYTVVKENKDDIEINKDYQNEIL